MVATACHKSINSKFRFLLLGGGTEHQSAAQGLPPKDVTEETEQTGTPMRSISN